MGRFWIGKSGWPLADVNHALKRDRSLNTWGPKGERGSCKAGFGGRAITAVDLQRTSAHIQLGGGFRPFQRAELNNNVGSAKLERA
jgi:hypothetical protein